MALFHKVLSHTGREMYIYYPGNQIRTPFKRTSITFLLETCEETEVNRLLDKEGLIEFADKNEIILSFPVPSSTGWNYQMDPDKEDDVTAFLKFQAAMTKPDDLPMETEKNGIPTFKAMMSAWHPMNDTKYLVGVGEGASMAYTLAACAPDNIAAVLVLGGELSSMALEKAVYAPIPISIVNDVSQSSDYFIKANQAVKKDENTARTIYHNTNNHLQSVVIDHIHGELCKKLIAKVWDRMFSKVRRPNTGEHGDCEPRMEIEKAGFDFYIENTQLGGIPHTWFVHCPVWMTQRSLLTFPMMLFFHGGSDNPAEAAEMSKFHELGEKEGFITVYPWGTDRCGWNCAMNPDLDDDMAYTADLIRFMIGNYPVDPERIYLSGFSNGAAQAQAFALLHPELIAAVCHIDSNWPGNRIGASEINWQDIIPFAEGMKRKREYDYRIPVWYTYGSREPSYPVYKGCSQQHQYDFWKMYNNIEIKPTPEKETPDPSGCGVPGDVIELLSPSERHPHHKYDVQRFYSRDEQPVNLYNYVVMREKGHDIAHMDAALGWNYVKKFRRHSNGSLSLVNENK